MNIQDQQNDGNEYQYSSKMIYYNTFTRNINHSKILDSLLYLMGKSENKAVNEEELIKLLKQRGFESNKSIEEELKEFKKNNICNGDRLEEEELEESLCLSSEEIQLSDDEAEGIELDFRKEYSDPSKLKYFDRITGDPNASKLLFGILSNYKENNGPFYKYKVAPTQEELEKREYYIQKNEREWREIKKTKEYRNNQRRKKEKIRLYDAMKGETKKERKIRTKKCLNDFVKCCLVYREIDDIGNLSYYCIDNIKFLNRLLQEQVYNKAEMKERELKN